MVLRLTTVIERTILSNKMIVHYQLSQYDDTKPNSLLKSIHKPLIQFFDSKQLKQQLQSFLKLCFNTNIIVIYTSLIDFLFLVLIEDSLAGLTPITTRLSHALKIKSTTGIKQLPFLI